IYGLFVYNIADEIRLRDALDEDMLCSFQFCGVTDIEYYGNVVYGATLLPNLVTEERFNHVIEQIHYYSFSDQQLTGHIFHSSKKEAEQVSSLFNRKGYKTVALTGDNSQEERTKQINYLENGLLDYIITVDIFNEGIDIP